MFSEMMNSPYRFFVVAGVLAAILCLFPVKGDAPQQTQMHAAGTTAAPQAMLEQSAAISEQPAAMPEQPVAVDLSERTTAGCMLHRTLYYAPCGHSIQRREQLPAQLVGLSRQALEADISGVIPGAAVTGFSGTEVDIALSTEIPCPLHWVLKSGEDNMLSVWQNRDGEALEAVRETDVSVSQVPEGDRQALVKGRIFDDVQALEGYLESLSS